jgi:hypothetical protein
MARHLEQGALRSKHFERSRCWDISIMAHLGRASHGLRAQGEKPAQVICPSGGLLTGLSSLLFLIFRKIFVPSDPNQI